MILDPAQMSRTEFYPWMIRCIVPRPIAWVSTVSPEGVNNLAPFSFFTAISTEPPTLCFAPGWDGVRNSKKDTLLNIEAHGQFVVNVVPVELAERMNDTATEFPRGMSEFDEAGLTPAPSERVSVPRVKESPVHFECERYDVVHIGPDGPGGGWLVIGKILLLHVDDAILTNGKVDYERFHALGRLGGMEYAAVQERFVMLRKKYTPKP